MEDLIRLLESRRVNCSRGMQKALRDINTEILARVLISLNEKYHHIFFRNMSDKAARILRDEMLIQRKFLESSYNNAYSFINEDAGLVCSVLQSWTNEDFEEEYRYPEYEGELNFDSAAHTVETFRQLSHYAREHGLMGLNSLMENSNNKLFVKSLELLLLAMDPFILDEILENYKNQYLEETRAIFTMIIKGVKGIYEGEHPEIIAEKLKSINEN